jgi:flagellar motor switch protein FliG
MSLLDSIKHQADKLNDLSDKVFTSAWFIPGVITTAAMGMVLHSTGADMREQLPQIQGMATTAASIAALGMVGSAKVVGAAMSKAISLLQPRAKDIDSISNKQILKQYNALFNAPKNNKLYREMFIEKVISTAAPEKVADLVDYMQQQLGKGSESARCALTYINDYAPELMAQSHQSHTQHTSAALKMP